jgi:putative MATE family efflux protein
LIIACIINTLLDIFFVYNLNMGVFGAALATVVSQFLSGAACLLFAIRTNEYFKLTKEDMQPDRLIIGKSVKLGVPLSMQFALIAISCMALQRVVNGYGPIAVAAFTATSRVEQVIHLPYQTLGASMSTFSGQNFGAKKYDRVRQGLIKGIIMMVIFSVLMLPVMQLGGETIVKIFVNDKDVIEMGAHALRLTSYFYVSLGMIYVVRGVMTGVGDGVFALQNGVVEVIGRLIFPRPFTMIPAWGLWGIWWSVGATWTVSGATALLRYYRHGKKIGIR